MDSAEIRVLLYCISFAVIVVILVHIILNMKEKKYIKSIKAGDIFVYRTDVDLYYETIEKYKYDLDNPFESTPTVLTFPVNTCIIKELKESKTGEMWVCYNLINTLNEITIAEKTSELVNHYRRLDDFLEFRKRVERFEM